MAAITLVNKVNRIGTQLAYQLTRSLAFPASVPVAGLRRAVEVKIASTRQEWEEAFQLVADNYQARGYEAGDCDCRFTSYHALPESVVLVAKTEGQVVATFSLVPDNTLLGLPLEGLYRDEIQELRRHGRHIFETTCLADRDLGLREFVQVFQALIGLAWQYGVARGGDTNVITINPRHRSFYTKALGYVPLGPWQSYPAVQGHPAEAYFLDPRLMRAKAPEAHARIFGEPLPPEALRAPRMPAALVRHFARNSSQTDPRLVEEILRYVETCGSPRRW